MDASRRQNNRKQYYVDGNTARQLSAVPAYQPERRERPDIRKPQTKRPAHRKVLSVPGCFGSPLGKTLPPQRA